MPPLIWIVDDSPTQLAFTERALGPRYAYERFADGSALIGRLRDATSLPDLVLLDWVMPGLSGDEVCRHLRRQPETRELPIVILTASRTDTDDIVCALDSGANDYVTKPFVPAELHARVGMILRAAELQRAAERERARVSAINELSAALLQAETVERVLDAMTHWLVASVADGCAVSLTTETGTRMSIHHRTDEAGARVAALDESGDPGRALIKAFPIRGIANSRAVVTRDAASPAFDARDLRMIDVCLEYSTLALEAALRSERERATTRFHEEMVGIVGHDLRGPLAAFGLGLDLLKDGAPDSQTLETVARLERSNARMNRIIELLLDVTRARIGTGIPVTLRPVGLRKLVADVVDELHLARPGVVLRVHGEEVEGAWDRDRLEQVVANLAGNAVQYGREGAPITLGVSHADGAAHLEVHNENRDGPIPGELLRTVFDPFQRGRASGNLAGLGLGLYIAHQIVRAHGGTIGVTSDEHGTTFRVSVPVEAAASAGA